MSLVSAVCPNCGERIQVPNDKRRAFCSYCGSQIITEAAIAYGKAKNGGAAYAAASADFVIEAGMLKKYRGSSTDVVVPEGVTVIQDVLNNVPITSVTLPRGVKKISGAFRNCERLKSITLPDSLEEISSSFDNCMSLTTVVLPKGLERISFSFNGCTSLQSAALPAGLRCLCCSFKSSGVRRVTIPGGLNEISYRHSGILTGEHLIYSLEDCFEECEFLEEVVFEEGVPIIGKQAFRGCGSLTSVAIPASVKRIRCEAFRGCNRLESVTVLGSDTVLDSGWWREPACFSYCPRLSQVNLSGGVYQRVIEGIREITGHTGSWEGGERYPPFWDTPWSKYR